MLWNKIRPSKQQWQLASLQIFTSSHKLDACLCCWLSLHLLAWEVTCFTSFVGLNSPKCWCCWEFCEILLAAYRENSAPLMTSWAPFTLNPSHIRKGDALTSIDMPRKCFSPYDCLLNCQLKMNETKLELMHLITFCICIGNRRQIKMPQDVSAVISMLPFVLWREKTSYAASD